MRGFNVTAQRTENISLSPNELLTTILIYTEGFNQVFQANRHYLYQLRYYKVASQSYHLIFVVWKGSRSGAQIPIHESDSLDQYVVISVSDMLHSLYYPVNEQGSIILLNIWMIV